ncbi:UDP-N-acetylmuramoyl-L-alanyl-D-glutamate--2,6-diaminopimelate ligase [uncultured Rubinisphaera sp.]|uniref:UDP-N-acetylmuramoyl-L-alanyl-D-glutamate--2, 6-diaminopimelate ligase n=1 Tax=uncultured Rubinisphaera sp. TaxID=1678686 RepID=UPI0030D79064
MNTVSYSRPVTLHSIRQLLPSASFVGCGDIYFRDLTPHSDHCQHGDLFVAVPGSTCHGNDYANQAVLNGATGILTDMPCPDLNASQCVVSDVRRSYAWLCQYLRGKPAEALKTIGVTGTNGKTTITWLLRSILNASQKPAGLLGTIQYDDSRNTPVTSNMTTPDAKVLAEWLQRMAIAGASHAVMEVSSHALDQKRIAGISLNTSIITNITQDHLDYHPDFDNYRSTKAMIADYTQPEGQLIINGDDPNIRRALERYRCVHKPITVGFDDQSDHWIQLESMDQSGSQFQLNLPGHVVSIYVPRPGKFNVMNAALAAVTANYHGCSNEQIISGIENATLPPGRLQQICPDHPVHCFVDYAHTPDAIENVISTMKQLVEGKLICLFGAGGNRDRSKRSLMTQAALRADRIILTADNSRQESTQQILDDLISGFPQGRFADCIEPDRRTAIRWAIEQAEPGDCVLILGRGHELNQIIGDQSIPFDDAYEAEQVLNSLSAISSPILLKSA